jgi:hypothetical protein
MTIHNAMIEKYNAALDASEKKLNSEITVKINNEMP